MEERERRELEGEMLTSLPPNNYMFFFLSFFPFYYIFLILEKIYKYYYENVRLRNKNYDHPKMLDFIEEISNLIGINVSLHFNIIMLIVN